jgi:cytoskeletal protein RodZ
MLMRNLPLYQSGPDWPIPAQDAAAASPSGASNSELRRSVSRGSPLFWLLVAAIALMAGVLTWVALPAPQRAPAAAAIAAPSVAAPPAEDQRQAPSQAATTVARDSGDAASPAAIQASLPTHRFSVNSARLSA